MAQSLLLGKLRKQSEQTVRLGSGPADPGSPFLVAFGRQPASWSARRFGSACATGSHWRTHLCTRKPSVRTPSRGAWTSMERLVPGRAGHKTGPDQKSGPHGVWLFLSPPTQAGAGCWEKRGIDGSSDLQYEVKIHVVGSFMRLACTAALIRPRHYIQLPVFLPLPGLGLCDRIWKLAAFHVVL